MAKIRILILILMIVSIHRVAANQTDTYVSATALIEQYHKGIGTLSADELALARSALDARPDSIGFFESTRFPIRSHYPATEYMDTAERILEIAEFSWEQQVLVMGFKAPPADCGNGGSDHLDIYLQDLPQGVGGYAAFSCYLDDTPEADAASFIALSPAVPDNFIQGAVTHEFNHTIQNGIDYWENITFKENTATWVMDRVFDDENYYFNYLRSYQQNPDWPIHKFSTTSTYQYGECMFLHFLAEYYGGGDPSIIVDIWNACAQNEPSNEPDYIEAMDRVIPLYSGGRDALKDALTEFAVWRTVTGDRDDGVHFHDGGLWPPGAEVAMDTVIDLANGLPETVMPQKPPYDYGFSYIKLENPGALPGAAAVEFQGDPAVDWGVVLIQCRDGFATHIERRFTLNNARGVLLLNPGMLAGAHEMILAVVNLSEPAFDPDQGFDGTRRDYSFRFMNAQPDTTLQIWTDQPMTCPGQIYGLHAEIEHYGSSVSMDFWLFLEIGGTFFSIFTAGDGSPVPQTVTPAPDSVTANSLFAFEMPDLEMPIPVVWHAALLQGTAIFDYRVLHGNLVTSCR